MPARLPRGGWLLMRKTETCKHMPFVSLRITRDGVTPEQKAQVSAEFTKTLERVLH